MPRMYKSQEEQDQVSFRGRVLAAAVMTDFACIQNRAKAWLRGWVHIIVAMGRAVMVVEMVAMPSSI